MKRKHNVAFVNCLATLVVALGVVDLAVPAPAAALTAREQRCQVTLARSSRRHFDQVLGARQLCTKRQLLERISPLARCSPSVESVEACAEAPEPAACLEALYEVGDERTDASLLYAARALATAIATTCTGIDLAVLNFPGSCPAPDPGQPFTEFDLYECIRNTNNAVATALLAVETPTITDRFVPEAAVRCFRTVSTRGRRMIRRELMARQQCKIDAEQGQPPATDALDCREQIPPYGSGTGSAAIDTTIISAYSELLASIPGACATTNVAKVYDDSDCVDTTGGKMTMFDLQLCVFDTHRAADVPLLSLSFPLEPQCGDGQQDSDEQCDDGNTSNNDSCLNDCTSATCGDAILCSGSNCTSGAGGATEACDDGNASDNDSCLSNCARAACGDGSVCNGSGCTTGPSGGVEQCDDANADQTDVCLRNCSAARCGDGLLCTALACTSGPDSGPEACDDSNTTSNDGCSAACDIEICGDGIRQPPREQCDNGFANNSNTTPDACRVNCTNPRCGDSVVDTGEDCDDGNTSSGDNCDASCQQVKCGNGNLDTDVGEECDNGSSNSDTTPNACRTNCTLPDCGDGIVDNAAPFNEQCDDSNTSNTDSCLTTCLRARCGDSVICSGTGCNTGPGGGVELCDDGNALNTDACLATCARNTCGDGFVNPATETCDQSGETASCDDDCTAVDCGDGNTNQAAGEECDEGGATGTCTAECTIAGCGDNIVSAGEECDDGNTNDNDTCPGNCQDAECGDGFVCSAVGCTSGSGGGPEFCDEEGATAGCDADCSAPACGDGITNVPAGEDCDTSGESATCDVDCTGVECGDGVINASAGEECEDGNVTSGDGCSAQCTCGPTSGEGGCIDPQCPGSGEIVLYAATTSIECTDNSQCPVGTCDTGINRCVTVTDLDTGWTGQAHNADINDQVITIGNLTCPGPFDPGSDEPCGECEVAGLRADTNNCRCNQNNRTLCFDPFALDTESCSVPGRTCATNADCKVCSVTTTTSCLLDVDCPAGEFCFNGLKQPTCAGNQCVGTCDCYFGPPLPLSSGNTPACVLNRFSQDVSGLVNVDRGSGTIDAKLKAVVFLGELVTIPCPVCGGTCIGGDVPGKPCLFDLDCPGADVDGTCGNFDPIAGDGLRGGICFLGDNHGQTCDVDAFNETFPAPGGGRSSLDCAPGIGKNVSSLGLVINLSQTTGSVSLASDLRCGFPPFAPELCPCGKCGGATGTTPCTNNADCAEGEGACIALLGGAERQNQCTGGLCEDRGDGTGTCTNGPTSKFCDGVLRANGLPFVNCQSNADCIATDCGPVPCGACTLSGGRDCFLAAVTATGTEDPQFPVGASAFCIPDTTNPGINSVAGLPGPGRILNQAKSRTFCAGDPSVEYIPGTGGCP